MKPHEIQRALRLITSNEFKRNSRFPITVLAEMAGLSRTSIYRARNGTLLTNRVVTVLGPLLKDILSGCSIAYRGRWLWSVAEGKMQRELRGLPINHD